MFRTQNFKLQVNARKVKFAVNGPLPVDFEDINYRDFEVETDRQIDR